MSECETRRRRQVTGECFQFFSCNLLSTLSLNPPTLESGDPLVVSDFPPQFLYHLKTPFFSFLVLIFFTKTFCGPNPITYPFIFLLRGKDVVRT